MVETVSEWLMGAVLPGLGAVLVTTLVGVARGYIQKIKEEQLREALLALVQAAEQLYGPGKGEAKRRFVREKLKQKGLKEAGREEIEAAVYRLNGSG